MELKYNNQTITYIVNYRTKNKIYLRVKNGIVCVSCPKRTPKKHVEEILIKYFDTLVERINKTKIQNTIHFNGVSYIPKLVVGTKKGVIIDGNEIIIVSTKNDLDSFKKVLYAFYKEEVEKEISYIISTAMNDFYEINVFPRVEVRYMKSMFGNYNRTKHLVKLSSILAKYDRQYIKHVLYHELSHVFEMNHSKKFYAVFDLKYPNAKAVRKEFKKIKYYDYL